MSNTASQFLDDEMQPYWSPDIIRISGSGPQGPFSFVSSHPYVLVGSSENADLVLTEGNVSRRHMYFQIVGNKIFAIDIANERKSKKFTGHWVRPAQSFDINPYEFQVDLVDGELPLESDSCELLEREPGNGPFPAILCATDSSELGRKILTRPLTILGRGKGCGLSFSTRSISAEHCLLFRQDEKVWVIDLHTSVGIQVDGQTVSCSELQDGSTVQMGRISFELMSAENEAANSELADQDSNITEKAFAADAELRSKSVDDEPESEAKGTDPIRESETGVINQLNHTAEIQQVESQLAKQKLEVDNLRRELENVRKDNERERQKLADISSELDEKSETLDRQNSQLIEQEAELDVQNKDFQLKLQQFDEQLKAFESEREALHCELVEFERARTDVESMQNTLQVDRQALDRELEQFERNRTQHEQQIAEEKSKQRARERDYDLKFGANGLLAFQEQKQEQDRVFLDLQHNILDSHASAQIRNQNEFEKLSNSLTDLLTHAESVAQDKGLEDLSRELKQARSEYKDDRAKLAETSSELDKKNELLVQQSSQLHEQGKELDRRSEELDRRHEDCTAKTKQIDEQLKAFESERAALDRELEESKRSRADFASMQEKLKSDRAEFESEREEFAVERKQYENRIADDTQIRIELDQLKARLDTRGKELDKQQSNSEQLLTVQEEKLAKDRDLLELQQKLLEDQTAPQNNYQDELKRLSNTFSELQSQLQQQASEHLSCINALQENFEAKIAESTLAGDARLKELLADKVELQDKLDELIDKQQVEPKEIDLGKLEQLSSDMLRQFQQFLKGQQRNEESLGPLPHQIIDSQERTHKQSDLDDSTEWVQLETDDQDDINEHEEIIEAILDPDEPDPDKLENEDSESEEALELSPQQDAGDRRAEATMANDLNEQDFFANVDVLRKPPLVIRLLRRLLPFGIRK